MSDYIIAIDGGGTKTLSMLYDTSGKALGGVETGYSNFSIDVEVAKKNLEEAIDRTIRRFAAKKPVRAIQAGIAGLSTLIDRKGYEEELSARFKAPVLLTTDALIALYAVKKDSQRNVIMVLGGTGSVVMANEDQDVHMIGGYGHLLGDEGSGYHLSIAALKRTITTIDAGSKPSDLERRIMETIGAKSVEDIKSHVYNTDKSELARLARTIAKIAKEGDRNAIDLLEAEGRHLGKQTLLAHAKLKNKANPIVALRGKFLLEAPFVKEALIAYVDRHLPAYELDTDNEDPVIGAYYLCIENMKRRIDQ
ncbi:MAG: BadF/BadG/BcrA/BcrD ATPase family protein [Acholeplasmataceae bacterium]